MPSLAIKSYAYDESRNELTVTFATGRGYVYSLVAPDVFAAFEAAASKGAFLNQHIRDRYPFRKAKGAADAPVSSLREALVGSSLRDVLVASSTKDEDVQPQVPLRNR